MAPRDSDVRRICTSALERRPAERPAFVAAACGGDESLRREVESLLAQQSAADRFLETPALEMAAQQLQRVVDGSRPDTLAAGSRFGPYAVLDVIGAGGMGQVYRARDSILHRDVALKVLPGAFAIDRDRLSRFEREAQVLASLNHPNIGAIHGLEEAGHVRALVLELIEGPTLAQRIAQGAIPLDDALLIAHQICDALGAAHAKGIVHRDLKPANIKVRPDGIVKVLDFGLAKMLEIQPAESALSGSPATMESMPGMVLGTAAYMSPEQSKGQEVERTTDVWAFGCVLFEMLAGRAAFEGESRDDILAAILKAEPNWRLLPASTPESIRRLLRRCLQKDPKLRWRDILDARIELDEARSELVAAPASHSMALRVAALSAVALVIGAALATSLMRLFTSRVHPPVTRTTIATVAPAALTANGVDCAVALSPDGTRVVYIGNEGRQVFVRSLDALDPVAIATGVNVRSPFVSPDGQWVGFFDGNTLKKVPMTGGPSITLGRITGATGPRGATWVTDDAIVFATSSAASGLSVISATGGGPVALTEPDRARGEGAYLWPERLPGGHSVLFTITAQSGGLDAAQIAVFDLRTRTRKVLFRGGSHAQYESSGYLVYAAEGTLRAVPFDVGRLDVRGTGAQVVPRLLTTAEGCSDSTVAGDTLVYVDAPDAGVSQFKRTVTWVDRTGREQPIGAPQLPYLYPRLSPDGTRLALDINADQKRGIWIWDFHRATLTPLTIDAAVNRTPEWTSDGKRIVYTSNRSGADNLWWQAADGSGVPEQLSTSRNVQLASGSTPDGRAVIFIEQTPSTRQDLIQLALDGSRHVLPVLQTPFIERNGVVSPNGRWIAYESDSSGQMEIHVRPFPDTSRGHWQVSMGGGTRPLWSKNGKELYFVVPTPAYPLMRVPVETIGASFHADPPITLFEGYAATNPSRTYDIASDGRFIMIKPPEPGQVVQAHLIVVQHWGEELRRLRPAH